MDRVTHERSDNVQCVKAVRSTEPNTNAPFAAVSSHGENFWKEKKINKAVYTAKDASSLVLKVILVENGTFALF